MDKFLAILDQVIAFLSNLNGTVYVIMIFIIEAIMRVWKTEKPKSILLAISAGIKLGIKAAQKLIDLMNALDAFVNKIIPQNVK